MEKEISNRIVFTKDEMYCCFKNIVVLEFVPVVGGASFITCAQCVFASVVHSSARFWLCYDMRCYSAIRSDKKHGFWQKSQSVDYQQFMKMLENGG